MKQLNEYDEVLKKPHPLFVYKNYINDIKFPTRDHIKESSEQDIFGRQVTLNLPEEDELFASFCNQEYFESVIKEFKIFSKIRPKLFKKIIEGDYQFGSDVKVEAKYNINNVRMYFDRDPVVREPNVLFDLIIFCDDFVNFEICEFDVDGNDQNLKVVECEKNTAVLFPFVPSSWSRKRIKEFNGKSITISFIVDNDLQEIDPTFCKQRVKSKGQVILTREDQISQKILVKTFDNEKEWFYYYQPWRAVSFSAYLEWKNFLEFEDEFPKFHVVQELDDRWDPETSTTVSVSGFDSNLELTDRWQKFIEYHISKYYFQNMFFLFDDEWKIWRPKLREKILSRNYTMGFARTKDYTNEFDILYDFQFIHDTGIMNKEGLEVHLDRSDKLLQSIVYFRHPEDECDDANLWLHNYVTFNHKFYPQCPEMEVPYKPNTNITIPYLPYAFHSVTPGIRPVGGHTRKMINVVFRVKPELNELSDALD